MKLHRFLNDLIILVSEENEILLINKTDRTTTNHFGYAHIVPISQRAEQSNVSVYNWYIYYQNCSTGFYFQSFSAISNSKNH